MSRSTPFYELERLFDRLNQQFRDAPWWGDEESTWTWGEEVAVDVVDEPERLVVTADLPGFDRSEIDVRVADRTLWIEASHQEETEASSETYLHRERQHRSVRRSLRLPTEVDAEAVTARLKNGVLTVTVPKAEPAEDVRHIDVEAE